MVRNDIFGMQLAEDKLDGTNHPLWLYMIQHVLVAKGFWNVVNGHEARLALPLVQHEVSSFVKDFWNVVNGLREARLASPLV